MGEGEKGGVKLPVGKGGFRIQRTRAEKREKRSSTLNENILSIVKKAEAVACKRKRKKGGEKEKGKGNCHQWMRSIPGRG